MKNIIVLLIFISISIKLFANDENVYKIAITKDWKPYYYLDDDGNPNGYAVEVFEKVAQQLNIKYEYVPLDNFKEVIRYFEENKVDIIPNIGITHEREQLLLFTQPTDNFFVKIYKRNDDSEINTIDDLRNKKVGVASDNVCSKLIDWDITNNKIYFEHFKDLIVALEENKIDAFCFPEPLIDYEVSGYSIIPLEKSIKEIKRGFGVSKEHFYLLPALNDAITELKLSGELQNIYQKWLIDNGYIKLSSNEIIFIVLSILGVIITAIILALFFMSKKRWIMTQKMLQEKVDEKTRILKIQNQRLKKLHKKLKDQTNKDPLTNIYNRKYYNERIKELLFLYKRDNTTFTLMLLDIDNFKDINDTYGHDVGDKVLIELTKIIKNHIRLNDYFFRVGGEEFAILFYATNLENSLPVAQKINSLIADYLNVIKDKKVTISAGITEIDVIDSAESIYKRADTLLYKAKNNGKNRVEYKKD